ncbi:MAG: ABC transporter ATP-binding protein [Myxococcota bacterium]|nr:ABC transporter ATP-binding protein [Myxococcota bacterium]
MIDCLRAPSDHLWVTFDACVGFHYNDGVFAFTKAPMLRSADAAGTTIRLPEETGASVALEDVSLSVSAPEGEIEILRGASLRVSAGEFVCLLGPSGSGKSTILNLFAGLAKPTSGRVLKQEVEVSSPGPDRAVVFQDAALFPWLDLRANVEFPLKLQGLAHGARAARSEELLRLVHLWRFSDRYPHQLSGGMRQRGAIARALATDPAVLLMDEPFASLDAQTREILQGEVERIWSATRKTIVFVTHNVREAVRLADRVVLMGSRPGRLLHEEVIDLPRPRAANDARVATIATGIARRIASEVEKVAREEADDAWVVPGGRSVGDPRRNLGRGI